MRNSLLHTGAILIIAICFSCSSNKQGTLDYTKLHYDTNHVALFVWDTSKYEFPNNSSPLHLKQEDLAFVDSLLRFVIDSVNKTIPTDWYEQHGNISWMKTFQFELADYKRQYLPYRDVNGQRIIYVNCFCKDFPLWRREVFVGKTHPGLTRFDLEVNLSNQSYQYLRISPVGDFSCGTNDELLP